MALNLDSVVFMTREAIPLLKKSKYPSIVNYASNAAWNAGGPGASIYATAKAGVVTFTRASAGLGRIRNQSELCLPRDH